MRAVSIVRRAGAGVLGGIGLLLLLALTALTLVGLQMPAKWWSPSYVGGFAAGSSKIVVPPFGPLSQLDVFNIDVQRVGTHLYLLGSDGAGHDLLGLTAHAVPTSMLLVALVVAARIVVGMLAGFAIAEGAGPIRTLSRGMGRWISGIPYLMLAIVLVDATTPAGRWVAFVIGMAMIGWRDIAETVAARIEFVRTQPFALGAKALGTGPFTFFRLHVMPYVRPALAVEIPFQASAVLVLLAELGYLGVFLGGGSVLVTASGGDYVVVNQPELGQLLAGARDYIQRRELASVLVPAIAIAAAALAFELIGVALRARGNAARE